jgi:hypothetical protein
MVLGAASCSRGDEVKNQMPEMASAVTKLASIRNSALRMVTVSRNAPRFR